jgi:hypothetical protein
LLFSCRSGRNGVGDVLDIRRFGGEYDVVGSLLGITAEELRRRDVARDAPVERWVAVVGDVVIGAATAGLRPDNRMFVRLAGDVGSYGPLSLVVREELGRSVYAMVDEADAAHVAALAAAGFATEMVAERFRIRFDEALLLFRKEWVPTWARVESADAFDEQRLFDLDNELRQDVLGSEGWHGNRQWFHDELTVSPPFDPAAYLVAMDQRSGELVGLVRIWRNPDGPRFGMIGIRRSYRSTTIAGGLMRRALLAASTWAQVSPSLLRSR